MTIQVPKVSQSTDLMNPLLVRVAIPHYCDLFSRKIAGYGSSRGEASKLRSVALARSLGSVLALARGNDEQILSVVDASLIPAPLCTFEPRQIPIVLVDLHVFVNGDYVLAETLQAFGQRITVHRLDLDDSRRLPHAARDFLLHDDAHGGAHLSIYMEDDLVIHDPLFIDKFIWFSGKTNHAYGLMPHRFELTGEYSAPKLFVDGPIDFSVFPEHHIAKKNAATGTFWNGQAINFDIASNPHSGMFALTALQRKHVLRAGSSDSGFIGPLETVATYTVLEHWPVMKPSWCHRDFLSIEHGHPSYLGYLNKHRLSRNKGC